LLAARLSAASSRTSAQASGRRLGGRGLLDLAVRSALDVGRLGAFGTAPAADRSSTAASGGRSCCPPWQRWASRRANLAAPLGRRVSLGEGAHLRRRRSESGRHQRHGGRRDHKRLGGRHDRSGRRRRRRRRRVEIGHGRFRRLVRRLGRAERHARRRGRARLGSIGNLGGRVVDHRGPIGLRRRVRRSGRKRLAFVFRAKVCPLRRSGSRIGPWAPARHPWRSGTVWDSSMPGPGWAVRLPWRSGTAWVAAVVVGPVAIGSPASDSFLPRRSERVLDRLLVLGLGSGCGVRIIG